MADHGLVFLVGFVLTYGGLRLWRRPGQPWSSIGGATIGALLGAVAVLASIYISQAVTYDSVLTAWIFVWIFSLGNGTAFLAGIAAALLADSLLARLPRAWGTDKPWNLLASSLAPIVAVLAVYMVAVPGSMQNIGITGIKAGGVEITMAVTSPTLAPTASGRLDSQNAGTPGGTSYTVYFRTIRGMVRENDRVQSEPLDFVNRPYFQREAAYARVQDPDWGVPTDRAAASSSPLVGRARAFWDQQKFIHDTGPLVECIKKYRDTIPDRFLIRHHILPVLEALTAIEADAHLVYRKQPDPRDVADLTKRLTLLKATVEKTIVAIGAVLPPSLADKPDTPVCNPTTGEFRLPPVDGGIFPPYLAMFLANAYAALLDKDPGLELLNNWIKYAAAAGEGPTLPDGKANWWFQRAVMEYGLIQEGDKAFPNLSSERAYLKYMVEQFLPSWPIYLPDEATDCDKSGILKSEVDNVVGARARLFEIEANILARYLRVSVETRSATSDRIGWEHERIARRLLLAADRCVPGEFAEQRELRRAISRIEAGLTLARWAVDGAYAGWLRPSAIEEARKEALKALSAALPWLRRNEVVDMIPDGPIRAPGSFSEVYRRTVEREILDLVAALAL